MEKNEKTSPSSDDSFETLNENNFEKWLSKREFRFEDKEIRAFSEILRKNFGQIITKVKQFY